MRYRMVYRPGGVPARIASALSVELYSFITIVVLTGTAGPASMVKVHTLSTSLLLDTVKGMKGLALHVANVSAIATVRPPGSVGLILNSRRAEHSKSVTSTQ